MSTSEQYLKTLIKSRLLVGDGKREASGFPEVDDYCHFIQGKMDVKTRSRMLDYLSKHPEVASFIASIRDNYHESDTQKVPLALELRAKNLIYPKKNLEKKSYHWVYLALALAAFILSFVFRFYFIQCVAVSVVLAFKWIMDEKSRKTQILIYQSLKETQAQDQSHDLHRSKSDL